VQGAPGGDELTALLAGGGIDDCAEYGQEQDREDQAGDEEPSLHSRPSLKPQGGVRAVVVSISNKTARATVFFPARGRGPLNILWTRCG
jgi:hypothetical protein